jgi:hypothetical protein
VLITAQMSRNKFQGKDICSFEGNSLIIWNTDVAKEIIETIDILVSADMIKVSKFVKNCRCND